MILHVPTNEIHRIMAMTKAGTGGGHQFFFQYPTNLIVNQLLSELKALHIDLIKNWGFSMNFGKLNSMTL